MCGKRARTWCPPFSRRGGVFCIIHLTDPTCSRFRGAGRGAEDSADLSGGGGGKLGVIDEDWYCGRGGT